MRIQEAVQICKESRQYARPLTWKGQSRGVDLGQTLTGAPGVMVVQIINKRGSLWGSRWNPTPEDLLEDWEIVTVDSLWKESSRGTDDQEKVG